MTFGLYLHFPFCTHNCSYCDFYRELYNKSMERRFFEALRLETEHAAELYPNHSEVSTIFVGGGTPSLATIELFADWLALVRKLWTVPDGIEFSLECNPESVTSEKLLALRKLGVNRPTLGIQSFHPELLQLLNRRHRLDDTMRAVYLINATGFTNFGTDMIFGLPLQTTGILVKDIDQIVDLKPPHISFYQLTVEPETPLAKRVANGTLKVHSPDFNLSLYRGGCERMAEAGYERYEVSNFARPGFECKHNVSYWDGSEYLGLGPSAHSFMNNSRFYNSRNLTEYLESLHRGELPRITDESGENERVTEAIMLGLRMSRGIDRATFANKYGFPLEARLNQKQFDLLVESGHIIPHNGTVRLSDEGIVVADEITRRLLLDVT
jgi:oxygen-independent coproporphyrinogen III oxidase